EILRFRTTSDFRFFHSFNALHEAIIVDHWKDPSDGTMFALCKLDPAVVEKNIKAYGSADAVGFFSPRSQSRSGPPLPRAEAVPKPTVPPRLAAKVAFREPSGNDALDAGEQATLSVTATNSGKGPAYAVRLVLSHESLRGLSVPASVAFGKLEPGQSVTKEAAITASEDLAAGQVQLKAEVKEGNGFDAAPQAVRFETRAFKAPKLEVSAVSLGGGGVVSAGEVTSVSLSIVNTGEGPAQGVTAALDLGSADIFASGDISVALGTLEPGASKRAEFQFVVNNRFKGKTLPIAVTLSGARGRANAKVPLGLAIGESAPELNVVTVKGKSAPAAAAPSDDEDVDRPRYKSPESPDDFAVVVGVEKYSNELPEAQFAERDARAVRAHLIALGYPERNIKYLAGARASKSQLEAYLQDWLPRMVKPESRVFFYFSGHGAPDPNSSQAYLVPVDGDPNFLAKTAYPVKKLYADLNALKARQVIVALDSCFSGAGGRSVLAKDARPLVNKLELGEVPDNVVALTASDQNQISGALEGQSHGAFTYYLLRGLNGAAADASGGVTVKGLYDYLVPKVQDAASRHNRDQTPQLLQAGEQGQIRLR
ncbi:MAG: caspase family protein, partial [Elusimicrobiota bacterium]